MRIEFDPDKDALNREKHGLSLADSEQLDLAAAAVIADLRYNYGEARFQAYGRIDGRLHVLAFTMRGDTVRAISFRKANQKEEKRYGDRHKDG